MRIRNLLLGLRSIAADRGDVELVIAAFFTIQDPKRSQLGHPFLLQDNLKRRLAVMLVRDAEGANFRSQGADLRRDLDQSFVLLDQAMISTLETFQIQSWNCKNTCARLISIDVSSFSRRKERITSSVFGLAISNEIAANKAIRVPRNWFRFVFSDNFSKKTGSPISPTFILRYVTSGVNLRSLVKNVCVISRNIDKA